MASRNGGYAGLGDLGWTYRNIFFSQIKSRFFLASHIAQKRVKGQT